MNRYIIIAYPQGERQVVGNVWARGDEDAIQDASVQAAMRGEYVDVERDGRCIAVCDGQGVAPPVGDFRS